MLGVRRVQSNSLKQRDRLKIKRQKISITSHRFFSNEKFETVERVGFKRLVKVEAMSDFFGARGVYAS